MNEVLVAIKKVTAPIIWDSSTASREKCHGVAGVGAGIMQMDRLTKQNTTIVKEMAAANLNEQVQGLAENISVFTLANEASGRIGDRQSDNRIVGTNQIQKKGSLQHLSFISLDVAMNNNRLAACLLN